MGEYDLHFSPTVPAKRKRMRNLPEPPAIYGVVRDTAIELPCMLAMWLSFTMPGIRGLRVCDIKDGMVTINQVIVDVDGLAVTKAAAKEYERNRSLSVPPYIMRLIKRTEAWQHGEAYLVPLSGQAIYKRFKRLCNKANLEITFHDLRHPYVKHTTKNKSLQKQKSQAIKQADSLGFALLLLLILKGAGCVELKKHFSISPYE